MCTFGEEIESKRKKTKISASVNFFSGFEYGGSVFPAKANIKQELNFKFLFN